MKIKYNQIFSRVTHAPPGSYRGGLIWSGLTAGMTYGLARVTGYSWKFTLLPSVLVSTLVVIRLSRKKQRSIDYPSLAQQLMNMPPELLTKCIFPRLAWKDRIAWGSVNHFFRNQILESRLLRVGRDRPVNETLIKLFCGPPKRGPFARKQKWCSSPFFYFLDRKFTADFFFKTVQIENEPHLLTDYALKRHQLGFLNYISGKEFCLKNSGTDKEINLALDEACDVGTFDGNHFFCSCTMNQIRIFQIENKTHAKELAPIDLAAAFFPKFVRLFQYPTGQRMLCAIDRENLFLCKLEEQTSINYRLPQPVSAVAVSRQENASWLCTGTACGTVHCFAVDLKSGKEKIKLMKKRTIRVSGDAIQQIRPLGTWGLAVSTSQQSYFVDLHAESRAVLASHSGTTQRAYSLGAAHTVEISQRTALVSEVFHTRSQRRVNPPSPSQYFVDHSLVTHSPNGLRLHRIKHVVPHSSDPVGDFCAAAIPLLSLDDPVLCTLMTNDFFQGWKVSCYPFTPSSVDAKGPKIGEERLSAIPLELIVEIVSHLNPPDLHACSLVNKNFYYGVVSLFSLRTPRIGAIRSTFGANAVRNTGWQVEGTYAEHNLARRPVSLEVGGKPYILMLTQKSNTPRLQLIHALTGTQTTLALQLPTQTPISFDAYTQGEQTWLAVVYTQSDKKFLLSIYTIQNTGAVKCKKSIISGFDRLCTLVRFFQPKDGPLCALIAGVGPNKESFLRCQGLDKQDNCTSFSLSEEYITAIGMMGDSSFWFGTSHGKLSRVQLSRKGPYSPIIIRDVRRPTKDQILHIASLGEHKQHIVVGTQGELAIYRITPFISIEKTMEPEYSILFAPHSTVEAIKTCELSPTHMLVTGVAKDLLARTSTINHYVIKQRNPRFRDGLFAMHRVSFSRGKQSISPQEGECHAAISQFDARNETANLIALTSTQSKKWCLTSCPVGPLSSND